MTQPKGDVFATADVIEIARRLEQQNAPSQEQNPRDWFALRALPAWAPDRESEEMRQAVLRELHARLPVRFVPALYAANDAYRSVVDELRAISLGLFPVPVSLDVRAQDQETFSVSIIMRCRHRDTGLSTDVRTDVAVSAGDPREQIVRRVFFELRSLVLHELGEWFFWHGERFADPHASEP